MALIAFLKSSEAAFQLSLVFSKALPLVFPKSFFSFNLFCLTIVAYNYHQPYLFFWCQSLGLGIKLFPFWHEDNLAGLGMLLKSFPVEFSSASLWAHHQIIFILHFLLFWFLNIFFFDYWFLVVRINVYSRLLFGLASFCFLRFFYGLWGFFLCRLSSYEDSFLNWLMAYLICGFSICHVSFTDSWWIIKNQLEIRRMIIKH